MKFTAHVCIVLVLSTQVLLSMENDKTKSLIEKRPSDSPIPTAGTTTQIPLVELSNEKQEYDPQALETIYAKMDTLTHKVTKLEKNSITQSNDINKLTAIASTCRSLLVPTALTKAQECYQKREYAEAIKLFTEVASQNSDPKAKLKAEHWLKDMEDEKNEGLMRHRLADSIKALQPYVGKEKETIKKSSAYQMLKRLAKLERQKNIQAKACVHLANIWGEKLYATKVIKYLTIVAAIQEVPDMQIQANERLGRINWKLHFVNDAYESLHKIIEAYGVDLNKKTDEESQNILISHNQRKRIWRWLGAALYTQDNFEAAKEYFEKALKAVSADKNSDANPTFEDREAEALAHACLGDILVRGLGGIQKNQKVGHALLKAAIELHSSKDAYTIASMIRANTAYERWRCNLI